VVRSDLLEDSDVPVFCQIGATQINPLVSVEAIKTMVINLDKPVEGVKGIYYHPSQSALGLNSESGIIENPVLDNLGYLVIFLERNSNESSMPDFFEGNLTARIRYDIEKAFGVGKSEYYLPVLSDDEWKGKYTQYAFWDGRGYLRAEDVEDESATISIYSGASVATSFSSQDKREYSQIRLSSFNLKEGETSPEILFTGA
jgi:hypothetical protein